MKKFVRKQNPVFFDVGANYGQTIDEFFYEFNDCNIFSFEPVPEAFKFLQRKTEGLGKVKIYNYALGAEITNLTFYENSDQNMSSFLKIDTQEFELEVLKGAKNLLSEGKIGLQYFEVTFMKMYEDLTSFGELFNFVEKNGCELINIYPIKFRNNKAGWTDVLFKHREY